MVPKKMDSKKTKECTKCGTKKPIYEFNKDSSKNNGVRSHCKDCRSKAITKQRKIEEELNEYNKALLTEGKEMKKTLKEYDEKINNAKTKSTKEKYTQLYNETIDKIDNLGERIIRRSIEYKADKLYGNLKYRTLKKSYEEQLVHNKDKIKEADDKEYYQNNIDYYLGKLESLENVFSKNIPINNSAFTEVVEKIREMINKGYIAKLEGQLKLNDEDEYHEYKAKSKEYFSSINELNSYISSLEESSDMDEMFFIGNIKYGIDKFKKVDKTKKGDGTTFQYSIKEYEGDYCYIPTENNCFLKCYKWLREGDNLDGRYKEFCFQENNNKDEKVQPFIMSNAKFSRFNEFMEDSVQYYNPTDCHTYPKINKEKYNYVYYLHNPYNCRIGHYCLIDKNNKKKAIKEIEEHYEQKWKELDKTLLRNVDLLFILPEADLEVDKRTFIYDVETYKDENGKQIPYAVASLNLNLFRSCVSNHIKNKDKSLVENLPEEQLNKLLNKHIKYFIGEDCIKQYFKYLGDLHKKDLILFAHNGAGFDSEIVIEQIPIFSAPIKKGSKLLSVKINNPYITDKWKKWFFETEKELMNKKKKIWAVQKITLRCTLQHVNTKLSKWCEAFKIPNNLRKIDFNIADITKDNYMERKDEWLPYLKNDILSLACCVMLYNEMMIEVSELNAQSSLTLPSLSFKTWINKINGKGERVYASADKYTRDFIRKSVKGGRVAANIKNFDKSKEIGDILTNQLGSSMKKETIIELVDKYNILLEDVAEHKNDPPVETLFAIRTIEDITEELKCISKEKFMYAADINSLYPSAMADEKSEYPRMESVRKFRKEEEKEILNKFNSQTFRPKTGIFKILYNYPSDMLFTPIFCKDKVNKTEVLRSRTGNCCDILTSVDIQEIVRCGGKIIKIFDGMIFEENFQENPFREFVLELYKLKAKFKIEGNKVGYALVKLLLNALYGKMVQKDINTKSHLWCEGTLKKNYTDDIKYEKITDNKYFVQEDIGDALPELLMPSHLGTFILSHSKRIMNDAILEIDGFKQPKVYYTDTDSIYIEEESVKKLKEKGFLDDSELGKLSNDLDDDAKIFYGLFLAPKIKLVYALDNKGNIIKKQTFKGFQRDILKPEDFIKMFNNEEVKAEVSKPWINKLGRGIYVPLEDKQIKIFSTNINLIKRREPDSEGIMRPYNSKVIDEEMLERNNINLEDWYTFEEKDESNEEVL